MHFSRTSRTSILLLLCLAVTIMSGASLAADVNLIGVPIKLKSTYTKFENKDKATKSAPAGMRFLIVDETSGTPETLTLQPVGSIPPHSIPENALIDKNSPYTVTAPDFKAYWTIDLEGASSTSKSSLVNLQGSKLKLRADFDGLIGPKGTHEVVAKDETLRVRKDDGENLELTVLDNGKCRERSAAAEGTRSLKDAACAEVGPLYSVKKEDFGPEYWDRTGWSYGPLFTPFKMRFKDKSLTGEAALGGYLGYEYRVYGVSVTPAVHAGLSMVTIGGDASASKNINDTTSTPAFTWGFALIMKPGENYQAGIVLGKDRIGGTDGAAWNYEGRWWLSIAIGYNFAR